jgi:predicted lipoprotein with Yx(FWY)xxD motif
MKKSSIVWLIVVIVVIVLGIWYWSSSGQPSSGYTSVVTPTSTPTYGAGAPVNLVVLNSASTTALGTFIVAMNGMTLYKYANDTPGTSTCTGQCATVWPPYTIAANEASSSLAGVGGSVGGQVSVITRADGSYQVTYNGMPLYFYSKDVNVGDTTGQGVGGVWSVVSP